MENEIGKVHLGGITGNTTVPGYSVRLFVVKEEVKSKYIKTFLALETRYHSQRGEVSQAKCGRKQ